MITIVENIHVNEQFITMAVPVRFPGKSYQSESKNRGFHDKDVSKLLHTKLYVFVHSIGTERKKKMYSLLSILNVS